jgi:hypothetical protein
MKADLEICGYTYQGCLTWLDEAFLKGARINIKRRPWKTSPCQPGVDPLLQKAGWDGVDLPPTAALDGPRR